jgi:glycosyltransferase involved in cell wall biosynthesis
LIDDGRTGLLFEPGSATALARRLSWAETHPHEMQQIGERARREYERKYTPAINYRQLVDIYRDAIDESRCARAAAG